MNTPALHIEASDSLEKKVRVLTRFLGEDFFHESGLMYAMWHWKGDELRPFRASDFEGMSAFKIKAGVPMEDWYQYENSPYTSGVFLWSQVLRFQVTGEEEALRHAARAFRSIVVNFELCAANGERGLLCKPYGAKFTRETSPDQYVPVVAGLWEYRKIADEATKKKIDELLPAFSDWWRLRNYKIVYFDREGDWLNHPELTMQYGPLYIMMHTVAHQITGREECLKEAQRITEMCGAYPCRIDGSRAAMVRDGTGFWPDKLHGCEYDPSRRPYLLFDWENRGAIWLAAASVAWLLENGPPGSPATHLLQHVLANYYRHARAGLNCDLHSPYWTQTDLETDQVYPVIRPRISKERKDLLIDFDWNFFSYASGSCCGDVVARVTDTALLAHRHAPGFSPGALTLVKAILHRLDDERLLTFIDPDGKQIMPEDRWITEVISSETPALTLLTYWRARGWKIDLEKKNG